MRFWQRGCRSSGNIVRGGSDVCSCMAGWPVQRKVTEEVGLGEKVKAYVQAEYGEESAREHEDDARALDQLRERAVERPAGSPESARAALCKYHAALCQVQARFPVSRDRAHVRVAFPWTDSFRPRSRASIHSIHFEKAAVLFNLGALHTRRASSTSQPYSLKAQSTEWMRASSFFSLLHDSESSKVDRGTHDVSLHCASMLRSLCLALAQECVYRLAVHDNKSHPACARLAIDASSLFADASSALETGKLSWHVGSLSQFISLRRALMHAHASYHLALDLTDDDYIGERISRLQAAHDALAPAVKAASNTSNVGGTLDECEQLLQSVTEYLTRSRADNEQVFMQVVQASLPEPQVLICMADGVLISSWERTSNS